MMKYEEIKSCRNEDGLPKEKIVFQEDVKLLHIIKGQEFVVKKNFDGHKFITIGKMNLSLTEYRNQTGIYKRYKLLEKEKEVVKE